MRVLFSKIPKGDIIALFIDTIADNKGNIESYMRVGQHGAASPSLEPDLKEATYQEFAPLLKELISIGYKNLEIVNSQQVNCRRQPTKAELNFGYGAIHYAEIPIGNFINAKTGGLKKYTKGTDGLRYYR